MICTDCNFESITWKFMKNHYKEKHPELKNPSKYFTNEAKKK